MGSLRDTTANRVYFYIEIFPYLKELVNLNWTSLTKTSFNYSEMEVSFHSAHNISYVIVRVDYLNTLELRFE